VFRDFFFNFKRLNKLFLKFGKPWSELRRKIRFRVTHIFREEDVCADKLANLGFIHRESFHWYNRLPYAMFLKFFFMNRYSLPLYNFC